MTAMGCNSGSVPESAFWPGQSKMTFADSIYARLPSKAVTAEGIRIFAEPRMIGSAGRGRKILSGKLPFRFRRMSYPGRGNLGDGRRKSPTAAVDSRIHLAG